MSVVYLVRHGKASIKSSNYDNLSDLGREQAEVLGKSFRYRVDDFNFVQHGTLQRHSQTAEHFKQKFRLSSKIHVRDEWNEYDHTDIIKCFNPRYSSRIYMIADMAKKLNPKRDFKLMFGSAMQRWMSGDFDNEYEESWPAFQSRCNTALNDLLEKMNEEDTAIVFTSGGVKSAIVQRLLNLPNEYFMRFNTKFVNCSVTKIISTKNETFVSTINDYAHFEKNRDFITYI